jgi:hypothetical protein
MEVRHSGAFQSLRCIGGAPSLAETTSVHGGKITNAKMIENASQTQISRRLAILLSVTVSLSLWKKGPGRSDPGHSGELRLVLMFQPSEKIRVLKSR